MKKILFLIIILLCIFFIRTDSTYADLSDPCTVERCGNCIDGKAYCALTDVWPCKISSYYWKNCTPYTPPTTTTTTTKPTTTTTKPTTTTTKPTTTTNPNYCVECSLTQCANLIGQALLNCVKEKCGAYCGDDTSQCTTTPVCLSCVRFEDSYGCTKDDGKMACSKTEPKPCIASTYYIECNPCDGENTTTTTSSTTTSSTTSINLFTAV